MQDRNFNDNSSHHGRGGRKKNRPEKFERNFNDSKKRNKPRRGGRDF